MRCPGIAGLGLLIALAAVAQSPDVRLVVVARGFSSPVDIQNAGDGSGRLFIVEQRGRIRVARNGVVDAEPFLDISGRVQCCGERGLLGLAFPPGFAGKDHFYVYYTDRSGDLVIARFRLAGSGLGDPATEQILLTIPHRQFGNHNGGQLAFGPKDGFLYIGTGDGGGAGDNLGSGQNTNTLLGKILRIDVESGGTPYSIPPSNPFVGRGGFQPEIWAYGLRNPWRFSFDRETGDLYIGDVGQDRWEELDFQPASSAGGENYGWNVLEAGECFRQQNCSSTNMVRPIVEYRNPTVGCSVIAGRTYRGSRFPPLRGLHFYGDFCSGRMWALRFDGAAWQNAELRGLNINMSAFGEDEEGSVYVVSPSAGTLSMFLPGSPALSGGSVVNAASFAPGVSPGSAATIFGSGMLAVSGVVSATSYPLPRELHGTAVTINGIRAPLYAIASARGQEQINFQVPYEVANAVNATIVVTNSGVESAPVSVPIAVLQPGIFLLGGSDAAALDANLRVISAANPIAPGGIANLFVTGLGPLDNPPGTGQAAQASPLARTLTRPPVTIGGFNAEVLFSGLAPGIAGLYQVQVRIPAGARSGLQDVIITSGGAASNAAKLAVR